MVEATDALFRAMPRKTLIVAEAVQDDPHYSTGRVGELATVDLQLTSGQPEKLVKGALDSGNGHSVEIWRVPDETGLLSMACPNSPRCQVSYTWTKLSRADQRGRGGSQCRAGRLPSRCARLDAVARERAPRRVRR